MPHPKAPRARSGCRGAGGSGSGAGRDLLLDRITAVSVPQIPQRKNEVSAAIKHLCINPSHATQYAVLCGAEHQALDRTGHQIRTQRLLLFRHPGMQILLARGSDGRLLQWLEYGRAMGKVGSDSGQGALRAARTPCSQSEMRLSTLGRVVACTIRPAVTECSTSTSERSDSPTLGARFWVGRPFWLSLLAVTFEGGHAI